MDKENKEGNPKIALEYISDESNNSIDADFKATSKYIALMPNGLSVKKNKSKTKNKILLKKNTRISSNNDEEIEYFENDEDDNNNDNDDTHEKNTENIQLNESNAKFSDNNVFNYSDNNLIITHNKRLSRSSNINYCLKDFDKCNNSENNNINIKDEDNNEYSKSAKKLSGFSPSRKKRRIFLEEKKKRGLKKSIYAIEQKVEKKEEKEKIYRKDKNGTEICKKNKRKVKISFLEPFVKVTPIESFKKYNIMLGMPKGEKYINSRDNCQCCLVF